MIFIPILQEEKLTDGVSSDFPRSHRQQVESGFEPIQFSRSLCLTLCNPMDCSMPGLPVHQQLLEFTQAHVH